MLPAQQIESLPAAHTPVQSRPRHSPLLFNSPCPRLSPVLSLTCTCTFVALYVCARQEACAHTQLISCVPALRAVLAILSQVYSGAPGKSARVRSVSVSVTVPLEHSTTLQDFVKVLLELYFLSSNSSSLGKTQISRCCEGSSALSFPLKQRYVKSSELDVEVVKSSHKTKTKVSKYSEQSEKLLRTRQTPVSQYTHF